MSTEQPQLEGEPPGAEPCIRFYRGATDLDREQRQKPEALNPRPCN